MTVSSDYVAPSIETIDSQELIDLLGPAVANGSRHSNHGRRWSFTSPGQIIEDL